MTAAATPSTSVPAVKGQRKGFKMRYAFENPISFHAIWGEDMLLPVILMPNQRQKPYRGTMVHGLLINDPVRVTILLTRKIQARKRQLRGCRPIVGVNATKTPRENARASFSGGSSSARRERILSLIHFISEEN